MTNKKQILERAEKAHTNLHLCHVVIDMMEDTYRGDALDQAFASKLVRMCKAESRRQLNKWEFSRAIVLKD